MFMLMIVCRCAQCSTLLEHPLQEFYHDLDCAIEEAKKRNSRNIPLMCARCTEKYPDGNPHGYAHSA
jgi:hypothetical protein